jgi:tetratricopeptide (TPR) repeat protein
VRIHPSDFLLRSAFGCRDLPGDRRRALLNHLGRCARCRERLREYIHPLTGQAAQELRPAKRSQPDSSADYDAVFERSSYHFDAREAALARERSDAPGLLHRLLDQPPERREILVRNGRRYQTWALAELVLEKSRETAFEASVGSEEIARLGLLVVDHLDPIYYGRERINDLAARALALIGNAHRIRSQLRLADSSFKVAADRLHRGTGDPLEKAGFLELRASFFRARRHLERAERALERASAIYWEAGESHRVARVLVGLGFTLSVSRRHVEAIRAVLQAVNFIDENRDPYLKSCASHNLIDYLTRAHHPRTAMALFRMSLPLYEGLRSRKLQSRRLWIEGNLVRSLGREEEAKSLLAKARDAFMAESLVREARMVAQELAEPSR